MREHADPAPSAVIVPVVTPFTEADEGLDHAALDA